MRFSGFCSLLLLAASRSQIPGGTSTEAPTSLVDRKVNKTNLHEFLAEYADTGFNQFVEEDAKMDEIQEELNKKCLSGDESGPAPLERLWTGGSLVQEDIVTFPDERGDDSDDDYEADEKKFALIYQHILKEQRPSETTHGDIGSLIDQGRTGEPDDGDVSTDSDDDTEIEPEVRIDKEDEDPAPVSPLPAPPPPPDPEPVSPTPALLPGKGITCHEIEEMIPRLRQLLAKRVAEAKFAVAETEKQIKQLHEMMVVEQTKASGVVAFATAGTEKVVGVEKAGEFLLSELPKVMEKNPNP